VSDKVEDAIAEDNAKSAGGKIGWVTLLVAALFGLIYAYNVWEGIANLIGVPNDYISHGLKQSQVPWWLLVIGLAIPIIVFFAAFFLGLRRSVWAKALIYILGIAVVAALLLGVVSLGEVIFTTFYNARPPAV
jgi:hypothetical protein